ncbi:Invasion protein IalB, involved in pathogenesis [Tistlia consotensis]|uniref:Invasion protein IalB, involved in pathogenesis n=1 Tax=Tistlia consotensis USBA 355 TaxID=560819 RepID=A0A1Y6CRV7_9PROT|nr:invasion associated locus B family protein [Tistlia consotensis]SMF85238.1 Invasion protein IalB, involved in pathogenesis [Tistlia consotensis USBA 355]SNR98771.1 Invasion protein IalB, involved in pathogenesis [Tistlia consotensis]
MRRTFALPLRTLAAPAALAPALALAGLLAAAPAVTPALAQSSPAPTTVAPGAPADETVKAFQSWQLRCGTPPGAQKKVCQMEQDVFREGTKDQQIAKVAVGFPPGANDPGMLILSPLATWLPPGIGFQLDSGQEQRVPVQRCSPQGCVTEILIEAPLLKALKAGTQINLTIHDRAHQPVKGTISLLGFTAAFDALNASRS